MMRRLHAFLPGAATVAAFLAVALIAEGPSAAEAAPTFEPTLAASVSDTTPGAHADTVYDFHLSAPDANFADVVSFLPPQFNIAHDADIPNGAIVGELYADVTLGLLNTSCSTALPAEITLYEATTNVNDVVFYYYEDGYHDLDGDGIPEWGEHYPGFLTDLFPGVQPIQRSYGQVYLAGVWSMVNFLVFEPGTSLPFFPAFDESLGYPTVALLNNPYGQILISPISDFCTPFTTANTIYGVSLDNPAVAGDQGGFTVRTNPATDGTYVATSFVRSLWDADGDSIESNIDPCHYLPDTVWDPRTSTTAGDADNDGLPATCDPNDNQANSDQDGDGYVNRLDLCPFQDDYGFDADGDDVGDACDRAPYDPSDGGLSQRHSVCTRSLISIGAGGEAGAEPPCPDGPTNPVINFFEPWEVVGVGNAVTFEVSVSNSPYGPGGYSGVAIHYGVTGANPGSGDCVTDNDGLCQFSYTGAGVGSDIVTVSAPDFDWSESATVNWQEAPVNDLFANAIVIDSLPYEHTGETFLSGREPGEDTCGTPYEGSVWYQFTVAENAMMQLTIESEIHPNVGVYTGDSVDALEKVYCRVDYGDDAASVSGFGGPSTQSNFFEVEAGRTYNISIEAYSFPFGGGPDSSVSITLDTISGISVGDVNCDSSVGVVDALVILRLDAALPVPTCATGWGDVNCDSRVDPIDALILLIYDSKAYDFTGTVPGCLPIGWSG